VRFRRRLFAVLAGLALAAVAYVATARPRAVVVSTLRAYDIPLATPVVASRPPAENRPRFRYSVIPGGVYSRAELSTALATDPVAAAHYVDFDLTRARVERVEQPRAVHVSYRVGDRVYWTRNKVWLRPGEALLSDGVLEARGRCGNLVSDEVMAPVGPEEPPVEALDLSLPVEPPGLPPLLAYDLMFAETPSVQPQFVPPLLEPVPSNPLTLLPPPAPLIVTEMPPMPPIGPVPEPTTLALLGTGAALLAGRSWKRRRRQ
jgi:hypothetical protein